MVLSVDNIRRKRRCPAPSHYQSQGEGSHSFSSNPTLRDLSSCDSFADLRSTLANPAPIHNPPSMPSTHGLPNPKFSVQPHNFIDLTNSPEPDDPDTDHLLAWKLHQELNEAHSGEESSSYICKKTKFDTDSDVDMDKVRAILSLDEYSHAVQAARARESTAVPNTEDDARIARELQARFEAEAGPADGRDDSSVTPGAERNSDADLDKALISAFGTHILSITCARCKKHLIYDAENVKGIFARWFSSGESSPNCATSILTCPRCNSSVCIGCNNRPVASPTAAITGDISIIWCCDRGRLAVIWVLLCYFDHHSRKESKKRLSSNWSCIKSKIQAPGRSLQKSGVGYGGSPKHAGPHGRHGPQQPQPPIPVGSNKDDDATQKIFRCLTELLPSLVKSTSFDQDPPIELLPMIRRSLVLEKAAELLRNDSIGDVCNRQVLYDSLMSFVTALSGHHLTAPLVFSERRVYSRREHILSASFGEGDSGGSQSSSEDKAKSLAATIQNLKVQAMVVLRQAQADATEFSSPKDQAMLALCKTIISSTEFVELNRGENEGKPVDSARLNEDLAKWHKENCVSEQEDDPFLSVHHYGNQARGITDPPKGRMRRLTIELANLRTSLPEGIYLRHGEGRLDVMKAVIVGPKGTPYDGGLFEFDILCTKNYPTEAPKVIFRTTGGGVAHFNPNLYPDGKVCLSLLGTWSGEPWRPGHSTILQVLVSMQSMIFCDEPWCNEPGRESHAGTQESMRYNQGIRRLCLKYGILDWLKSPPAGNMWEDVINIHFRTHAEHIVNTISKWAAEERLDYDCQMLHIPPPTATLPMRNLVSDIETHLAKFRRKDKQSKPFGIDGSVEPPDPNKSEHHGHRHRKPFDPQGRAPYYDPLSPSRIPLLPSSPFSMPTTSSLLASMHSVGNTDFTVPSAHAFQGHGSGSLFNHPSNFQPGTTAPSNQFSTPKPQMSYPGLKNLTEFMHSDLISQQYAPHSPLLSGSNAHHRNSHSSHHGSLGHQVFHPLHENAYIGPQPHAHQGFQLPGHAYANTHQQVQSHQLHQVHSPPLLPPNPYSHTHGGPPHSPHSNLGGQYGTHHHHDQHQNRNARSSGSSKSSSHGGFFNF